MFCQNTEWTIVFFLFLFHNILCTVTLLALRHLGPASHLDDLAILSAAEKVSRS